MTPRMPFILCAGLLLGLALSCTKTSRPIPTGPTQGVVITCVERGIYKITGNDLAKLSVDLAKVDVRQMALVHYDKSVPFYGEGLDDGRFDPGDAIYFFSDGGDRDSVPFINTEKNFYPANQRFMLRLDASQFEPLRFKSIKMKTPAVQDTQNYPVAAVSGKVHCEQNPKFKFIENPDNVSDVDNTSASQARPKTDFIFWELLTFPQTNRSSPMFRATFDLPHAAEGPVSMRVRLYAASDNEEGSLEHRVSIKVNDADLGEAKWSGTRTHEQTISLPAGICLPSGNKIIFELREPIDPFTAKNVDPQAPHRMTVDMAMLDWFELEYRQKTIASMNSGEFLVRDDADQKAVSRFSIDSFSGEGIKVFDLGAREVLQANPFSQGGTWGVNLERSAQPTTLVAMTDQRALRPLDMKRVTMPGLFARDSDCELLILTNPEFTAALKPLVEWKESRGLKTKLVEISDLFNEKTSGYAGPEPIRDYIEHVYKSQPHPRLKYVMLVGDSFAISKYKSFCPAYSYLQSGAHANDNYFASFDRPEGPPLVAVGRLSVDDSKQVTNIVNKIKRYESGEIAGSWQARVLTIAAAFSWARDDADSIINKYILPNYVSAQMRTSLEDPDPQYHEKVSKELMDRLNAGSLVTAFFGHGGGSVWEVGPAYQREDFQRHLFDQKRVAELTNKDKLPLVCALTCYTNNFDNPNVPQTLGETFVNSPGGAIAVVGAVGRSLTAVNVDLLKHMMNLMVTHNGARLGDYFRQGLEELNSGAVNKNYLLLGDPSLEFSFPLTDAVIKIKKLDKPTCGMDIEYTLPPEVTAPADLEFFAINSKEEVITSWTTRAEQATGVTNEVLGPGRYEEKKMRLAVYVKDKKGIGHVGNVKF